MKYNLNLQKVKKIGKMKKSSKIAIATLACAGILFSGVLIYDNNFDHTEELCPLCKIVGLEHQVNKINKDSDENGLYAKYYDVNSLLVQYDDEEEILSILNKNAKSDDVKIKYLDKERVEVYNNYTKNLVRVFQMED